MHILVIGAAGMIGRKFTESLVSRPLKGDVAPAASLWPMSSPRVFPPGSPVPARP